MNRLGVLKFNSKYLQKILSWISVLKLLIYEL
jgi:hypothetical protein